MIDVAEQKTRFGFVNNQPNVAAYASGPEVLVFRVVDSMKSHSGIHRIHLEVERRGLNCLLLIARQPCEAIGESVGDEKFH